MDTKWILFFIDYEKSSIIGNFNSIKEPILVIY